MSYSEKLFFFTGTVIVQTDLDLIQAADSIANKILGENKFGGIREYVRDEFPAVYTEVLGIRFVLYEQEEDVIVLECYSRNAFPDATSVDLSDYLCMLLHEWADGTVVKAE